MVLPRGPSLPQALQASAPLLPLAVALVLLLLPTARAAASAAGRASVAADWGDALRRPRQRGHVQLSPQASGRGAKLRLPADRRAGAGGERSRAGAPPLLPAEARRRRRQTRDAGRRQLQRAARRLRRVGQKRPRGLAAWQAYLREEGRVEDRKKLLWVPGARIRGSDAAEKQGRKRSSKKQQEAPEREGEAGGSLPGSGESVGNSSSATCTSGGGHCTSFGAPNSDFTSISYQGGQIMTGRVNVYLIYYGNWPAGSGQQLFEDFISSIGSTAADGLGPSVREWWAISALCTQKDGQHAASQLALRKSVSVRRSSDLLSENSVKNLIARQLLFGRLPFDRNGIYAVLSSSGVRQQTQGQQFCQQFCGWHSNGRIAGLDIKYLFIGWSGDCNGCQRTFSRVSVNGAPQMEGMVDTLAHELSEVVVNPDLMTGWYDRLSGLEGADVCNAYFPDILSAGAPYFNVYGVNGRRFLLQANFNPLTQTCQLSV